MNFYLKDNNKKKKKKIIVISKITITIIQLLPFLNLIIYANKFYIINNSHNLYYKNFININSNNIFYSYKLKKIKDNSLEYLKTQINNNKICDENKNASNNK